MPAIHLSYAAPVELPANLPAPAALAPFPAENQTPGYGDRYVGRMRDVDSKQVAQGTSGLWADHNAAQQAGNDLLAAVAAAKSQFISTARTGQPTAEGVFQARSGVYYIAPVRQDQGSQEPGSMATFTLDPAWPGGVTTFAPSQHSELVALVDATRWVNLAPPSAQ